MLWRKGFCLRKVVWGSDGRTVGEGAQLRRKAVGVLPTGCVRSQACPMVQAAVSEAGSRVCA